jgi:hypothetical protein
VNGYYNNIIYADSLQHLPNTIGCPHLKALSV